MSESDISTEPSMSEPVRWLDDPTAASALRGDLVHGATAIAGGVDYGATLTALRGAIAAQTGALAPAAVAGKSIGLKLALGGVLVIGAAAAWWVSRGDAARGDVAVKHQVATPALPTATEAATPVEIAKPRVLPAAAVEPTLAEPTLAEPTLPEDPEPTLPGPTEKLKKPKPVDGVASDEDDFLREAKLVAQARKQLGTSPKQALASTRKHDREFPKGALVEEARALEIRALAKLGRMDDAQRKADDFLRAFGDGAHAAAVRRAIVGDDDVQ